jgi:Trp operon repressor
MKIPDFAARRTAAEIALWRHGWAWPLAGVLGLSAVIGYLMVLQPSRQMHETTKLELAQEMKRPAAPAGATQSSHSLDGQQRLQALRAALSPPSETHKLVRRMVALAQAEQINVAQSEYQQQVNAGIGVTRVQISQPVRASYPQLRRYIEAVLQSMPNASLDQVVARRDNVGQTHVEARLKWSLWTSAAPAPASGTPRKEGMP